jgi:DNA-binding response OmpR family regulator
VVEAKLGAITRHQALQPARAGARVKAVRRTRQPSRAPASRASATSGLRLDTPRAVTLDGQPINLTVREFDLLQF